MNVRRLFIGLLLIGLFAMAVRETTDPDLWWHLRTGEFILQQGIPKTDIFSFTVPDNQWVTHEWLSEVIMWSLYRIGDLPALSLFFAAVITAAYILVFLRSDGRPYLAGFIVLLGALASAPLWGARPQMFNLLFAAFFVYIVEGFKDKKYSSRTLWILPIATIVWANLHSGYLFGIALLVAYVIGESAEQFWNGSSTRSLDWLGIRKLALIAAISFLAAAINPNGPELWIYPFFTLGSSVMQRYILEWRSPDFHSPIFWPFAALLILGIASWIGSQKRPAWTDLLLFGASGLAGLMSIRHIPLFSVVAVPIVCRYLLASLEGSRFYPLLSGQYDTQTTKGRLVLNWLLLAVAVMVTFLWITDKLSKNEDAIANKFPVEAVNYLEANDMEFARGFNSYGWGGYLIWRGIPVFVDGRADVYGDQFLNHYLNAFDLTSRWREPLDDYNVEYILIDSRDQLGLLLEEADDWQQIYKDDVARIFVVSGG